MVNKIIIPIQRDSTISLFGTQFIIKIGESQFYCTAIQESNFNDHENPYLLESGKFVLGSDNILYHIMPDIDGNIIMKKENISIRLFLADQDRILMEQTITSKDKSKRRKKTKEIVEPKILITVSHKSFNFKNGGFK